MACATELTHVSPDVVIWQAYDSRVKAELFSTALRLETDVIVVDPIPLLHEARQQLDQFGKIEAVIITNANHGRAAAEFGNKNAMLIPAELRDEFPQAQVLTDRASFHGVMALQIDGAAPGEFALHDERDGGTLILGDAVINFEPHGFTLLPARYCVDRKQMMRSLRRLLDLKFSRIFFAHGQPIITRAHDGLAALLNECCEPLSS